MRITLVSILLILLLAECSFSQSNDFDKGVRDTLALEISVPPAEGTNIPVTIEAWVFSDDSILSFSAGFEWHNDYMHLDSAREAPIFRALGFATFLYDNDDFTTSNINHIFQLGGLNFGKALPPNLAGRTKWATYYFTLNHWSQGDTIAISMLPESEIEYSFVIPGPFYPQEIEPYFNGPLLFPGISTEVKDELLVPSDFVLYQNFPNPFNPETTILFEISKKEHVDLEIFDIVGRKVRSLVNMSMSAGSYSVNWNGLTDLGTQVSSGTYFYRLKTAEFTESKKMILVR